MAAGLRRAPGRDRAGSEGVSLSPEPAPGPLLERARGTLVGLACGNLLGLPNEFREHPARPPVLDIEAAEQGRPWDDDLAQTWELGQSLAECRGLDTRDLGRRLLEWARTNGRGIGNQTRAVLALVEQGLLPLAAARVHWERSGRQAAGNGGLMRVAPVGLFFHDDPAACLEAARLSAATTHADPRCTQSAAVVAAAIAALLDGGSARAAAQEAARGLDAPQPELLAALESLGDLDLEDLPLRGPVGSGYTLTCALVGLWAAGQSGSPEELLLRVTNAGGDADTNGAVAGALLGARHGLEALPARWRERVPRRAELEQLAERLVAPGRRAP